MITENLTHYLAAVPDTSIRWALRKILLPLFDSQSSRMLNTPGLAIKAGGSAIVKSGAADCYALATGTLRKITAATDMPALAGTVTNAKFNVFCFFIDAAGTVTSQMGIQGATLAAVKFPQIPTGKAFIGFVIINPTGTGDFVGGTTALDDGTVVPTAVYVNNVSGYDPYCLTGV